MKNILYKYCLFSGLLLIVFSCDYKPKDEYFKELNPNLAPPVINLNINTISDTVYLMKDQSPTFYFSTGIARKQWAVVFINDIEQSRTQSKDGAFNLYIGRVSSTGIYKMSLKIYLSTGTGSLADQLDAEHFLYEKVWWLIVSENPSLGAVVKETVPENGFLKITWTPFKGLGFGRYILLRTLKGDYNFDTVAVVQDIFQTSAIDTTYVGEESTYVLKVYSGDPPYEWGDMLSTNNYDCYYGFPALTVEPYNEKDFRITWARSVFIKNIKGYQIMIKEENNYDPPTYITISDREITSYIYADPKFTFEYEFTVTFIPHKGITMSNLYDYSNTISGFSGTPSFTCNGLYSTTGANLWFNKAGRIYKYDVPSNLVTDSLISMGTTGYQSISVSPNNKYVTAISSNGFLFYNIENKASEIVSFSSISPTSANFSSTNIADNGIAVISDYDNLFLYDFVNHQLLNTATPNGDYWMYSISADGQYIFLRINYKYYCYHFTSQIFTKVWDDPDYQNKQFYFHATDPGKVVLYSGNTLSIVSVSTWIPQYQLTLDANNLINVDFGAGRILSYTSDSMRFYNLVNGTVELSLPTSSPLHGILLKDNYIYSIEGRKLKVF